MDSWFEFPFAFNDKDMTGQVVSDIPALPRHQSLGQSPAIPPARRTSFVDTRLRCRPHCSRT